MRISYSNTNHRFEVSYLSGDVDLLKRAGFKFENPTQVFFTTDYKLPEKLIRYCEDTAIAQIRVEKQNIQKALELSAGSDSKIHIYHPDSITPFPYQRAGVEYILTRDACILADQMGLGKGLFVNELATTPNGYTRIGDLKVNDLVLGSDGKPTKVIGVYHQGIRELYRFTFSDGVSILADSDHLWEVWRIRDIESYVLSTRQLLDQTDLIDVENYYIKTYYKKDDGEPKWRIPLSNEIAEKYTEAKKSFPRFITNIEFEKMGESVCIKVDAPDSLYVMKHGIVTHNTGQAILSMNMRRDVVTLIVCPAVLKYNWLKEIRKWMIGTVKATIYEGKAIRLYEKKLTDHPKTTHVHIVNYDLLKKHQMRLSYLNINYFIADESQMIKNVEADRTKIARYLAQKAKWKLFITGTPIYNRPVDLFVPLNLIDPKEFDNLQRFKDKWCGGSAKGYIKKVVMDELNQLLRSKYMVRRMAKDVLKDLPDKMKDVIVLSEEALASVVEKEQYAIKSSKENEERLKSEIQHLKEMAKVNTNLEAEYKSKVKTLKESKFKNFGEISKIRKELALKKVPYVIDFVKENLESNEDPHSKIVIFGHHTEVLKKIWEGLQKYKPVVIIGETSDKIRQQNIKLFSEKNDTRVFIGSMGAAGTGVDGLQNNCNTVVFAELDWTPSLVDQAESRLQRIGQKNTVWVYHIVADGSIDAKIAKLIVQKEGVSKRILDLKSAELYEEILNGK